MLQGDKCRSRSCQGRLAAREGGARASSLVTLLCPPRLLLLTPCLVLLVAGPLVAGQAAAGLLLGGGELEAAAPARLAAGAALPPAPPPPPRRCRSSHEQQPEHRAAAARLSLLLRLARLPAARSRGGGEGGEWRWAGWRRVAAGRRATGICRRAMAGWSRHRRRSLLLGRRHPGCGRGTRQVGAAAELPDGLPISYTGYGCLGSNRRRKTCAATGDGMWSAVDGAPQVQGGLSNQPKKLWES